MEWLKEQVEIYKDDPEFLTEQVIITFSELVVTKMHEKDLKRVHLAKIMGVSKAFITKILNGNPNMTVKTMVSIANALGCGLGIDLFPKGFELKRKALYVYSKSVADIPIPTPCEVDNASNA